jgi:hypothetical protein
VHRVSDPGTVYAEGSANLVSQVNPLLDWPPAADLSEALEQVRLARSFLVRMQELLDAGRLSHDGRAYAEAARNVRLRVHRALELGAADRQVLEAAASAYRSDLCERCGCIFYSKTEDPRFMGLCGDCLYTPQT